MRFQRDIETRRDAPSAWPTWIYKKAAKREAPPRVQVQVCAQVQEEYYFRTVSLRWESVIDRGSRLVYRNLLYLSALNMLETGVTLIADRRERSLATLSLTSKDSKETCLRSL